MGMAQLVVTAVLVEGRSKAEVARTYGVSRRWVITLVQRFLAEGEPACNRGHAGRGTARHGLRRPVEDEIIALRKELDRGGHEAGAATIAAHLEHRHGPDGVPAVSTIWRILSARGFVTPQPHKRPKIQLSALRRRAAQRTLATRHHPLPPRRRHRRRDPQHPRRPLPALSRQHRPADLHRRRRQHRLFGNRSSTEVMGWTPCRRTSSSVGTKSSAGHCCGCSGVVVTGSTSHPGANSAIRSRPAAAASPSSRGSAIATRRSF